jgi:hypothetical protein
VEATAPWSGMHCLRTHRHTTPHFNTTVREVANLDLGRIAQLDRRHGRNAVLRPSATRWQRNQHRRALRPSTTRQQWAPPARMPRPQARILCSNLLQLHNTVDDSHAKPTLWAAQLFAELGGLWPTSQLAMNVLPAVVAVLLLAVAGLLFTTTRLQQHTEGGLASLSYRHELETAPPWTSGGMGSATASSV